MKNKHLMLPESHCKYCRELAEDCGCSRGVGILDALALSDIHEKIDWKVKNAQESDTYEAEFIPAILYAQSILTANEIFNDLNEMCPHYVSTDILGNVITLRRRSGCDMCIKEVEFKYGV